MRIFTAHWRHYTDDYYAPRNRRMFLYREVFDQYSPTTDNPYDYEIESDWECSFGTMHPHTDTCDCDEYNQ
jgi:hypothetical protein